MNAAEMTIPYEKQSNLQTNRTCGAACLTMVYRSFGKEIPQAEIWAAIAKQNRFGSLASTTHLMARDALSSGFAALAVQARHPLQALRLCRESGVRAILNHRLKHNVGTGHYSVLVDIDHENVILHDPLYGPLRRLSHAELLELWHPRFPGCEIVGNVLIGVAAESPEVPVCQRCRTPIPTNVDCPNCRKPLALKPVAPLGCVNNACAGRMWNFICCPSCDYAWTFSHRPPPALGAALDSRNGANHPTFSRPISVGVTRAPVAHKDPLNLKKLFGELDKFCSHILSLPTAANHPDIKQQLDFIAASKEKLTLALAEELAQRKARQEQLANSVQAAKEKQEAYHKRMQEIDQPSPPLDGNDLGRALLKNLGLTG
jgi:hypothetical protein